MFSKQFPLFTSKDLTSSFDNKPINSAFHEKKLLLSLKIMTFSRWKSLSKFRRRYEMSGTFPLDKDERNLERTMHLDPVQNNKLRAIVLTGKARILILASFLAIVAFFIVDIALEFLFPLAHSKFGKCYRSSPRIGPEMSLSTAHNENESDNLSNGNGLRVCGLRISLSDQYSTPCLLFSPPFMRLWHVRMDDTVATKTWPSLLAPAGPFLTKISPATEWCLPNCHWQRQEKVLSFQLFCVLPLVMAGSQHYSITIYSHRWRKQQTRLKLFY